MTRSWQARYFNGSSALMHTAEVRLLPRSMEIVLKDETLLWPYKEVIRTMGFYPLQPVRFERGQEAVVVTERSIIESIKKEKKKVKNAKGPLRGLRLALWLPILTVISLGLATAVYFKGIPSAAAYVAKIIPPSVEERLGQSAEKGFLNGLKQYDNQELTKQVKRILTRLETAARIEPSGIKLKIMDAPVSNAFALPGGRLILFRGLIEETKSARELAGVMAHEIAHIKRRHATKGLLQHLSTYTLFSFIAGDINSVSSIASNLGNMRYSREFEAEADRLATRLLIDAGIDPSGLIDFFTSKREPEAGKRSERWNSFKYLSTHPDLDRRIEVIKSERAEYVKSTAYRALLPDVNWQAITAPLPQEPPGQN